MRDKLGVLLMQEPNGSIAVQLFEDPVAARSSFAELKGKPGDKPSRATFIDLAWQSGVVVVVGIESRDLPVPIVPPEDRPDALRLGDGYVRLSDLEKK